MFPRHPSCGDANLAWQQDKRSDAVSSNASTPSSVQGEGNIGQASRHLPGGGILKSNSLKWLHTDLDEAWKDASMHLVKPLIDALVQRIESGQIEPLANDRSDTCDRHFIVRNLPSAPGAPLGEAVLSFELSRTSRPAYHLSQVKLHSLSSKTITLKNPYSPSQLRALQALRQRSAFNRIHMANTPRVAKDDQEEEAPETEKQLVEGAGHLALPDIGKLQGLQKIAQHELEKAMSSCLENYPEALEELKKQTRHAYADFVKNNENHGKHLGMAFEHYSLGDIFFMEGILKGHKSLQDFLMTMDKKYEDIVEVKKYCQEHIENQYRSLFEKDDHTNASTDNESDDGSSEDEFLFHTPDDLMSIYETDLHDETQALDSFLNSCPNISNVWVARGIHNSEVNPEIDIHGFINASLILYERKFLSTSWSWKAASDFQGGGKFTPITVLDVNDKTPQGLQLKEMMLKEIASSKARIMMALECKGARGAIIEDDTVPIVAAEKEILLAAEHVVLPDKIIKCEEGYVLIGAVSYMPKDAAINNYTESYLLQGNTRLSFNIAEVIGSE